MPQKQNNNCLMAWGANLKVLYLQELELVNTTIFYKIGLNSSQGEMLFAASFKQAGRDEPLDRVSHPVVTWARRSRDCILTLILEEKVALNVLRFCFHSTLLLQQKALKGNLTSVVKLLLIEQLAHFLSFSPLKEKSLHVLVK